MTSEEKSESLFDIRKKIIDDENDIHSKLRKNPNKTKFLYTDYLWSKSKISQKNKEICFSILEKIKKDEKAYLFRLPAIRSFLEPADKEFYKSKIKEPRDLSYITKKLNNSMDYTVKEFHRDLELCWSNAISFNDYNTEAHQNALYFKEVCKKLYKEKGLLQIIEKENEREKENEKKETNSNISSINSTNDTYTYTTPLKILSKRSKNRSKKSTKEKIEKNDSINPANINNYKIVKKFNNAELSSSEIKNIKMNNKLIGKKRIREKNSNDKNEEKTEKKNKGKSENKRIKKSMHHIKSIKKKIKKIRRNNIKNSSKNNINNNVKDLKKSSTEVLNYDDIAKKYPITYKVIANSYDGNKVILSKNNINTLGKIENSINDFYENIHNNRTIQQNKNIKENIKENINNNIVNSCVGNMDKILELFGQFIKNVVDENKRKFFGDSNNITPLISNDIRKKNCKTPMKIINENKKIEISDTNSKRDNSYSIISTSKKNLLQNELSKSNKIQNLQNVNNKSENKNVYNINPLINNFQNFDKKEDKYYDLRIEISKYFDQLTDSQMVDALVFIENIRPQSLKEFENNDTIYINFEEFNDEAYINLIQYLKNIF